LGDDDVVVFTTVVAAIFEV